MKDILFWTAAAYMLWLVFWMAVGFYGTNGWFTQKK